MTEGLESKLSAMLFGIPGAKGVEFGAGFSISSMTGSRANDPFVIRNGKVATSTNNAGGINGGITNGMPVTMRVAFRPTPSVSLPQRTVDLDTMTETEGALASASEVSPPPAAEPSEPPIQEEQEKPDADIQTETALPASFSPAPGLARNLKNTRALLAALKPYLDDKRREKVDKMLSMMRLAEMAGYSKNLM